MNSHLSTENCIYKTWDHENQVDELKERGKESNANAKSKHEKRTLGES